MEEYNHLISLIALSMGTAWASGINLYATIVMLGWMGATGNIDLPPGLDALSNPMVIGTAGLMYCVEFFADKIPGVDSGWDVLHTFVRVPAGAILAAGAVGDVSSGAEIASAILGGGMALTTHSLKSGTRVLINTSPEPVSNWTASVSEDVAVVTGLWAALNHPTLFVAFLIVFIVLMIWLLPKLWQGIKYVFKRISNFFSGGKEEPLLEDSHSDSTETLNPSEFNMKYKKKE